ETLKRRDPREFAELLIALLRDPIKYQSRPVPGPGSPGELTVQGDRVDVQRRYSPLDAPDFTPSPDDYFTLDASGLPVLNHVLDTRTLMIDTQVGIFTSSPAISNHQNLIDLRNQLAQSPLGEEGRHLGQFLVDHPSTYPAFPVMPGGRTPLEAELNYEIALSQRGLLGSPLDPIRYFAITYDDALQVPVGRMAAEAETSAVVAQKQLQADVDSIDRTNADIAKRNAPVLAALEGGTGQAFGADRKAWSKWIADAKGYAFLSSQKERPTIVEEVPLEYTPSPVTIEVTQNLVGFQAISCFGAGTEVHTITGRRPIESLKVGDRVLTRDVATGALSYRPILTVFHNPPSLTLKVELGDETIVTTPWHRF
ncbi:Hint domain-containing protein, partial [Singulisphaera rosea]